MSDVYTDLNEMKEKEALDQSVALNRIVLNMMESKRKEDLWIRVVLIISILANIVISCIFIGYESQFTTEKTVTTTTVSQDTGEGAGNNVYQSGKYADYVQGNTEEVTPNGETNNQDNYYNNQKNS